MASNALLRSEQQLANSSRHASNAEACDHELICQQPQRRTSPKLLPKSFWAPLQRPSPSLKRQHKANYLENVCENLTRVWRIPRGGFNSITIWLQVLLVVCVLNDVANGEGNVGCKFVRTLCLEGNEVCFDDNIFGKCIPTSGVDMEDIEKTPLTEDQSRLLASMLEELQGAGLGWDHPYVQCRIQGTLYSMQKQIQLPPNLCANLAPPDIDRIDPLAFVRFMPPDDEFANRLTYPPLKKHNASPSGSGINTIFHKLQLQDRQLRNDPQEMLGEFDRHRESQMNPANVMDMFLDNERDQKEQDRQLDREVELETEQKEALRNRMELYHMLAASEPDPQPFERTPDRIEPQDVIPITAAAPIYVPNQPNDSNELYFPEDYGPYKRTSNARKGVEKNQPDRRTFFRELAQEKGLDQEPALFNHAQVQDDSLVNDMPTFKRRPPPINYGNGNGNGNGNDINQQFEIDESLFRNSLTPLEEEAMLSSNVHPHRHKQRRPERVYTEGGLITMDEQQDLASEYSKERRKEKARELLANMLGFTRHERLDVKKPGPMVGPPPSVKEDLGAANLGGDNKTKNKEKMPDHIKSSNEANKKKKVVVKTHSDEDHAPYTVDTEFAHVFVKNPIDSWEDGVRIINELANILHMQGYFSYLTVLPHEVSFRVVSDNPERKSAIDIARAINENRGVKNNILRRLGVTILSAGVGDKVKRDDEYDDAAPYIEEIDDQEPDIEHMLVYMFAGAGAAAIVVIFVTLILIKRKEQFNRKLAELKSGYERSRADSSAKDYKDLCRSRMAGNTSEPVAARFIALSKENERPPSSRSSTSSWSEEPALTNMDISTGHMVLSYMEDHLRNKGRLQREWEALCRYEAEPSARDAAQQEQCANLNRPGAPLPYDHSRVVLNHLANAEGLDYINASTITDHDPRAPAYVAAQGPLPTTLAHFWQMIWEQGAVVIVALCRLQENGDIACARYWPEEGAEVYHIYEVHLVSEHIWCDDYLVRSFYLKNLRTSETRTVTQFHFLSWPQGGVPPQAKALLDFRRKVNKSYRGRSCPIVVHGSGGSGRTGAYILLDLVLGRMNKGAREIDIAATLEHLRDQRAGVVATRQQFEFVLMAVAEEVHAILKALPANQSGEKKDLEVRETGVLKEEEEGAASTSTSATASASASTSKAAKETAKDKDKDSNKDKESNKDKDKDKEKDKNKEKVTIKETTKETKQTPAKTGKTEVKKK